MADCRKCLRFQECEPFLEAFEHPCPAYLDFEEFDIDRAIEMETEEARLMKKEAVLEETW